MTIEDRHRDSVTGCEHHAARMLASLTGGLVSPNPGHAGAAIRVFKAASDLRPFCWREG